MKNKIVGIALSLTWCACAVSIGLGLAVISPVGCQSYPWPSGQPSLTTDATDQVILRAEQTAQSARLTFDTLIHLERDNEAMLKEASPQIHEYANKLRRHGLDWVTSLRDATKTFKANRTPENQANISTWIATLSEAINEAQGYISTAKKHIGN